VLIAGVLLLVLCLAVWLLAPTVLALGSRTVRWQLASGFGEAPDTTASVVAVYLNEWPAESCSDGNWLGTPLVIETPLSVTITMRARSSFDAGACVGWYDFWGTPVEVQLSAPLGGRVLFDGSTIPPSPRLHP
jgi:hypothetical protein